MRNALQPGEGQETSHRIQPWAARRTPTRPPLLLPAYEHPAPEQLSAAAVALLDTYGRVKIYPKDTVLIYAGTPSPACYVVLSGRGRVYASAASGKELTLSMPGLGELFGDLGLVEEAPCVGTTVTLTQATLLVVPRMRFGACLAEHPHLALTFLRLAAQRLAHLSRLAKSVAFADVSTRITMLLSALAQEREDALVVEQRLTHQEIADLIGASRETVYRTMKELCGSGALVLANGQIRAVARTGHPPRAIPPPSRVPMKRQDMNRGASNVARDGKNLLESQCIGVTLSIFESFPLPATPMELCTL